MNELFAELPLMTREEWHRTPDFIILRFLNNMAADVTHKTQEIRDILELMLAHRPDLFVTDRFCVVERQLMIVDLEARRLWDECRRLDDILSPRHFSDFNPPGSTLTTTDSPCTTRQPQPDQHQDSSSVPSQDP